MTAPTAKAMEAARAWLNNSELHDVDDCDDLATKDGLPGKCSYLESMAELLDAFAAAAVADERAIIRDWISNNLGERGMTDLLLDIARRKDVTP